MRWGWLYDQLFEDRQEGDYVVFVSFEPEYVQFQLSQCSELLDELGKLLSFLDEYKQEAEQRRQADEQPRVSFVGIE